MNGVLMFRASHDKLPCLEAPWPIGPTKFAQLSESSKVASPNMSCPMEFVTLGVSDGSAVGTACSAMPGIVALEDSSPQSPRYCHVLSFSFFFQLFDGGMLQNCDLLLCKHFWNQLLTSLLRSRSSCLPHSATRLCVHLSQLQGPTHDYNLGQMTRTLTGLYGIIWLCSALRWRSRCLTAPSDPMLRPSWNVWAFNHSTS